MSQYTLYRAYYKQRRPSGSTQSWQTCLPLTISWTDGNGNYTILENPSTKCGYEPQPDPQYRWVNLPISSDYDCDTTTYTKYYKQKRQVSYDNGATWNDVSPAQYQRGSAYETNSIDCGYVAPTGYKVTLTYKDGTTKYIPCDSSDTLSISRLPDGPGNLRDIVNAEIGTCVSKIDYGTFYYFLNLTGVTIPNNITEIGWIAFRDCISLPSVMIPNSVKTIPHLCFDGCTSLTSITIPSSVTSIEESAFYGCTGFSSFTIPDSVETLGNSILRECTNLTSAVIGTGLTNMGGTGAAFDGGMFRGCTSLNSVTFKSPSKVDDLGALTFLDCTGLFYITLPSTLKKIGNQCFDGCTSLRSIDIPSSVTEIGEGAFKGCTSLTNFTVPVNVSELGLDIWSGCTSLESIIFLETTPFSMYSGGQQFFGGLPSNTIAYFTPELYDWAMSIFNFGTMRGRIRMIGS